MTQRADSYSKRISLTANMVQSSTVVEHMISSGYYWAAAAVLRQHMETLARIIELRENEVVGGKKMPNVSVLPFKLSQNYGSLSKLCHIPESEILSSFAKNPDVEGIAATRPYYHHEWSTDLLSVHIAHRLTLAVEMHLLHKDLYSKKEMANIDNDIIKIADILINTGFWEDVKPTEE